MRYEVKLNSNILRGSLEQYVLAKINFICVESGLILAILYSLPRNVNLELLTSRVNFAAEFASPD